ncbi:MAG: hypothetical protein CM15mP106_2030 [Candidatus Neomarinimicrobiota bacterium]|nr:MAG: hypothetical protein CM15mP106_2030 [Candidatus Neomarinimicrobiota bacterium]
MFLIGIIVAIVALDQWSKWMIKTSYDLYHSEPIIQGFFHFTYVTNDGMAFGLSFPGGKQVLLLYPCSYWRYYLDALERKK